MGQCAQAVPLWACGLGLPLRDTAAPPLCGTGARAAEVKGLLECVGRSGTQGLGSLIKPPIIEFLDFRQCLSHGLSFRIGKMIKIIRESVAIIMALTMEKEFSDGQMEIAMKEIG